MQSKKVVNQILFGSVAFGASFGIGLLANRDLNKALLTGAITIPATYAGAVITDKRRTNQEKLLRGSLRNQIQQLEKQQFQLQQSIFATTTTKEELEASINTRQADSSQLSSQLSELHDQRERLNQDLAALERQKQQIEEEKQQIEGEFDNMQTQVQALERQQTDLNQTLSAKTTELLRTETNKNYLQTELGQLQVQIAEQLHHKEGLNQEIAALQGEKHQLEERSQNLQTQVPEQQNENEIPEQEQINQEEQQQEDNGDLPSEWQEFMWELSEHEIQILKSIAEEDKSVETIKRIAEEQIKMPELLIESINERALDTIGDLIIEPGSSPPMIADDYLTTLKQMLKVYEDLAK